MTSRRPLVVISGFTSELPVGDTVVGASDATALASGNAALALGTTALASGNAALELGTTALASGDAALALGTSALASGNAALVDLTGKYNNTGGVISGSVLVAGQSVGEVSSALASGDLTFNFGGFNNFDLTLGGTSTLLDPVGYSGGQCGAITVRQDSVGSRLLSYSGAWNFAGGTPPVLTTAVSGVDVLSYYCSSNTEIQVVANLNFS